MGWDNAKDLVHRVETVSVLWGLSNGLQWLELKGRDRTEKQEKNRMAGSASSQHRAFCKRKLQDLGFHASLADTFHLLGCVSPPSDVEG